MIVVMLFLFGCSTKLNEAIVPETVSLDLINKDNAINYNNEANMQRLKLFVDDVEVDVTWEDNDSIKQIKELANQKPIIISAHQYGGFEQVGEIGQNIVSDNVQMTTKAGDIVLYAGNNIVVFYDNNSWSYTKLGKINETKEELKTMLDKSNVIFTIKY